MQTVDISKCIEGTFVRELKNRFLCEVLIDGVSTVCYVPSSCHLGNFLSLNGKKVLLIPTEAKTARTNYAIYAFPYKRSYIVLNTSMANRAVENSISSRRMAFLGTRKHIFTEHTIRGYKADFYIQDTNTIVEVKSVLSTSEEALFPTVYSERAISQFTRLKALLAAGMHVHYCVVSLNPYVKQVRLLERTGFEAGFLDCVSNGMTFSAHTCRAKTNSLMIDKAVPLIINTDLP